MLTIDSDNNIAMQLPGQHRQPGNVRVRERTRQAGRDDLKPVKKFTSRKLAANMALTCWGKPLPLVATWPNQTYVDSNTCR
jgi:hypothetical protein